MYTSITLKTKMNTSLKNPSFFRRSSIGLNVSSKLDPLVSIITFRHLQVICILTLKVDKQRKRPMKPAATMIYFKKRSKYL